MEQYIFRALTTHHSTVDTEQAVEGVLTILDGPSEARVNYRQGGGVEIGLHGQAGHIESESGRVRTRHLLQQGMSCISQDGLHGARHDSPLVVPTTQHHVQNR